VWAGSSIKTFGHKKKIEEVTPVDLACAPTSYLPSLER